MRTNEVVWGINFKRFIRRKNEQDLWSAWRRSFGANKISQAGELHGISEIGSGRLFVVKPYGLTGFSHLPPAATLAGLTPGTEALYTGGVDVKLGLRSNLVANLTGNTDFADADVDTQQFNLTPYKLFFPEKRQFFLENAGIFNFAMGDYGDLLFFSRQIGIDPVTGQQVPMNGGGKITGSLAGFDVGFMDASTRSNGPNPYANYAVFRLKRSLPGGSYVGFMGIDKRAGNTAPPFNQSGGVDTRIVLMRNLVLPPGLYRWTRHQLTYGTAQDRRWVLHFFERFGTYYNGRLNEVRIRASYRPSKRLSFDFSQQWDRFRLPLPNGDFSVVLAGLQGNYSFSRFLTFTSVIQMDTSNTQAVSANLRLRYNYRPDSDLYIIYNVGTQFASIAPANPPQVRETRFALKWTYSFAP